VDSLRSKTALLVGLSTVLLFFSTYSIAIVNGQSSNPNNKTSDENSVLQTENLDPFKQKGSDNNVNSGSADNPSQTNDASTNNKDKSNDASTNNKDKSNDASTNDKDKSNDASTNDKHDDNKKESDNSKSSEDNKDSKSKDNGKKPDFLPFP
jgi:hypothetical protein